MSPAAVTPKTCLAGELSSALISARAEPTDGPDYVIGG